LFHAKDFQSLMYPCFTMCRILGIFPYKMNDSTFKVSKLYYFLAVVIICVYNIYALMTMYNTYIYTTKMDIKTFPITLLTMCAFIATDFIIIVTLILTNSRARLLQTILKISSKLPAKSYQKLSRLIHAKDIISFLYIVWVTLKYLPLQRNNLLYTYIYLVVLQMDMLYMNCVCILKACFKEINDNLANIRELIITNNESHRVIYHEQRNSFLIMELKELEKQHLTISDTIQTFNMIFSLQLLATVVMTFSTITGCLYFYILNWEYFTTHTSASESFHVTTLSHIMHIFIKIVLIVWACETGKDQAQQINTSIHDVFNSTTNEQIRDEVI